MREIRQSGSEGGAAGVTTGRLYPYPRSARSVPVGTAARAYPMGSVEYARGSREASMEPLAR